MKPFKVVFLIVLHIYIMLQMIIFRFILFMSISTPYFFQKCLCDLHLFNGIISHDGFVRHHFQLCLF